MQDLLSGLGPISKQFLTNIRMYNNCVAIPSFGHKAATEHGWNPTFRIQGQVFHCIGSLLPPAEDLPKFLQVYFLDSHSDELRARNNSNLNLHIDTVWYLGYICQTLG